jgi:hypothetical protein
MLRKIILPVLIALALSPALPAQEVSDQEYINRLEYRREKLEIIVKHRTLDIKRSYSSTDISTTTYTYESYSQTTGNISTSSLAQAEAREITDWYIYKGGVRELSDLELLEMVGESTELAKLKAMDDSKARMRLIGSIAIGTGVVAMVGGASLSASQQIITGGALLTAAGFFISAFNNSPHHYLDPDYAQAKVDQYNIALKRKLNLPLTYE